MVVMVAAVAALCLGEGCDGGQRRRHGRLCPTVTLVRQKMVGCGGGGPFRSRLGWTGSCNGAVMGQCLAVD